MDPWIQRGVLILQVKNSKKGYQVSESSFLAAVIKWIEWMTGKCVTFIAQSAFATTIRHFTMRMTIFRYPKNGAIIKKVRKPKERIRHSGIIYLKPLTRFLCSNRSGRVMRLRVFTIKIVDLKSPCVCKRQIIKPSSALVRIIALTCWKTLLFFRWLENCVRAYRRED